MRFSRCHRLESLNELLRHHTRRSDNDLNVLNYLNALNNRQFEPSDYFFANESGSNPAPLRVNCRATGVGLRIVCIT